jgi:hypothetical protein
MIFSFPPHWRQTSGVGDVVGHARQPLQRVHRLEVPAQAGRPDDWNIEKAMAR